MSLHGAQMIEGSFSVNYARVTDENLTKKWHRILNFKEALTKVIGESDLSAAEKVKLLDRLAQLVIEFKKPLLTEAELAEEKWRLK